MFSGFGQIADILRGGRQDVRPINDALAAPDDAADSEGLATAIPAGIAVSWSKIVSLPLPSAITRIAKG
jgi:hypothetical protein